MQNEILKPVLDTDEVAVPRYDIVGPNGSVIQQNVELRLKNEVVQEGTPYDEESVLPASLREQLELPQPATPAEAFLKMLKVGGGAVTRNRAPTSADAQSAGKIWIVPKMSFNNLMPNALSQSASNWACTAASASASGKAATITGDGTAASLVGLISMDNASSGDSVFVQADITVNADANKVTLELLCGDVPVAVEEMDVPASGATAQLVARPTLEAAGALKLKVTATYNTASVQSGKSITVENITVWNLTADMCQIEADLEFSQEDAASYIGDYGMFQAKEYELSQYWWVCRGVLDGEYYWYRYDELANLKVNLSDKASTAQAQAGVVNNKWMSPALVKASIDTLAAKAQNILSDETKTLLGGNASMVPNDAFVALKNLIDGISPDKIGATRVVTGSFAGTGSTSSKTITAGFKPKAAIFAVNNYGIFASGGQAAANVSGIAIWIEGITKINTGGYSYDDIQDTVNVTQTETGLILQNDETYNLPNEKGVTYYYAIFG